MWQSVGVCAVCAVSARCLCRDMCNVFNLARRDRASFPTTCTIIDAHSVRTEHSHVRSTSPSTTTRRNRTMRSPAGRFTTGQAAEHSRAVSVGSNVCQILLGFYAQCRRCWLGDVSRGVFRVCRCRCDSVRVDRTWAYARWRSRCENCVCDSRENWQLVAAMTRACNMWMWCSGDKTTHTTTTQNIHKRDKRVCIRSISGIVNRPELFNGDYDVSFTLVYVWRLETYNYA